MGGYCEAAPETENFLIARSLARIDGTAKQGGALGGKDAIPGNAGLGGAA